MRDKVKVMVGGAPVTEEYAVHVGADGYGADASNSVQLAKNLMIEMGYDIDQDEDLGPSEGASALRAAVDAVENLMGKAEDH